MKRLLALTVVALVPVSYLAAEEQSSRSKNINMLFTVTVSDIGSDGTEARRATRMLALDGSRTELSTGWKVPIPTTTYSTTVSGGDHPAPLTSFSYQDIGVMATLEGRVIEGARIRVSGKIEVSAVEQDGTGSSRTAAAPTVAAFSHRFNAVLDNAVEVILAEVPKPGGGSMILSLSGTIQK